MSEIPAGWESAKLGEVCSKPQYGYTTKSNDIGDVRYLRTTDITPGEVDWDRVPYCVKPPEDKEKYKLFMEILLLHVQGQLVIVCC